MVLVESLGEGMTVYCTMGKELIGEWVDKEYEVTLNDARHHLLWTDFFLWSLWMYTSHMQNYPELKEEGGHYLSYNKLTDRWDEIVAQLEAAYDALCK